MEPEIQSHLDGMNKRFDDISKSVDSRVDGMNKRFDDISKSVDSRVDGMNKRFDDVSKTIDSRINDVRTFFLITLSSVGGIFAIVFGIGTFIAAFNFNSERTSIREFQKKVESDFEKIKDEVRKVDPPPELELLGIDNKSLAGQQVKTWSELNKDQQLSLKFTLLMRNIGTSSSGPLYMKIYTSDPIPLGDIRSVSTDEPEFKSEIYFIPKDLEPSEIPGNFTTQWFHTIVLRDSVLPPPGKYPALIKVYYGKGKIVRAGITLVTPEQ